MHVDTITTHHCINNFLITTSNSVNTVSPH